MQILQNLNLYLAGNTNWLVVMESNFKMNITKNETVTTIVVMLKYIMNSRLSYKLSGPWNRNQRTK